MAAFANITVNDGQATPVAHSFTTGQKITLSDGRTFFQWLDFSVNGGIPLGANRIEMYTRLPDFSSKPTGKAGSSEKTLAVDVKVTVPTLETLSNNTSSGINPQPTHAYDTSAWLKVVRSGRAGTQPVKDALAFVRNFSNLAVYTDTVLSYATPST